MAARVYQRAGRACAKFAHRPVAGVENWQRLVLLHKLVGLALRAQQRPSANPDRPIAADSLDCDRMGSLIAGETSGGDRCRFSASSTAQYAIVRITLRRGGRRCDCARRRYFSTWQQRSYHLALLHLFPLPCRPQPKPWRRSLDLELRCFFWCGPACSPSLSTLPIACHSSAKWCVDFLGWF